MSSEEAVEYGEAIDYEEPIGDDEPVPAWHLEILEERLSRYGLDSTEGISWEEFEKQMIEELEKSKK